jgi:chaperone BCS1
MYEPPCETYTDFVYHHLCIFGLDIYCLSLNEIGLTESDLNKLFSILPRHCIVLLEIVLDGLAFSGLSSRRRPAESMSSSGASSPSTTASTSGSDSALIRPGCVDLQVHFTLATHSQILDTIARMYSTEYDIGREIKKKGTTARVSA